MSLVYLIAADKPLPLCDKQTERTSTVLVDGVSHTISFVRGFCVSEHRYYRHAVDALGYSIKPWQYELEVQLYPDDLTHLKQYLTENFSAGETVELWSIWVGIDQSGCLPHAHENLINFNLETLKQFLEPGLENGAPGQCRLTITI